MKSITWTSRRSFLKTSLVTSLAAAASPVLLSVARAAGEAPAPPQRARVALTAGANRADMTLEALKALKSEIRQAIGKRRVVIKPNNVAIDTPLCATHVDSLVGILEFLKSIEKLENVMVAESSAAGPTLEGFENYRYLRLANKYQVKFTDLDKEGYEVLYVFDEKDFRPHPVRMSKVLLDPENFIISAAKLKTHDRVVATLSLKNIVFGAPIKDPGFRWSGAPAGTRSDKPIPHGSGFRGINYNLFALAPRLHPHLAVIDGLEGMEGNGPVGGTLVRHGVCIASLDWLAADRVGVELMGIDFAKVGYLNYCAQAKLGVAKLDRIEVIGQPIAQHIKTYKLSDNIEQQLIWMKPA